MDDKMIKAAQALSVDRDGVWRHEGIEITHERTWKMFSRTLDRDDQGKYFLRIGHEFAYVQVEDAPLIVDALRLVDGVVRLTLKDETHEELDPDTLYLTAENVPYCTVRDGKMPAKFSRTAYYELAEFIREEGDGFVLDLGETTHPIRFE